MPPIEAEEEELILEVEEEEEIPLEEDASEEEDEDEDEDSVVLAFADEEEEAEGEEATPLLKRMREELRSRTRENRELRRKVEQNSASRPEVIEVGEKPTLEGCDYDSERFEEEYDAWKARAAQAEKAEADQKVQVEQAQKEWTSKIADYERKKADLRVPGKAEAEAEALAHLSQHQQAVIVKYADNPAALMIALGKSPKKLETLSGMQDLAQFTFTVARLEKDLKMAKRKAPEPEGIVRGSAPHSAAVDKRLERLEREAEKTGDRTELVRYKRESKKAA